MQYVHVLLCIYPAECDCNGYDSECDNKTGVCTCYDVGVLGPNCSVCNTNSSYEGDADNFCFCESDIISEWKVLCKIVFFNDKHFCYTE